MSWGARYAQGPVKTKKDLKKFVAEDPERVVLFDTSAFDNGGTRKVLDLPLGKYAVVGPDVYTNRKWYATVEIKANGDGKTAAKVS